MRLENDRLEALNGQRHHVAMLRGVGHKGNRCCGNSRLRLRSAAERALLNEPTGDGNVQRSIHL
jgi:hypothetical protein